MNRYANRIQSLALSAVCLALCLVLPFLTGQLPEIGNMLCPMHIPVLLCGFICSPVWAAAVGFLAPLVRFALFGMPPIYPVGIAMCFELAAYGAVSGLLWRRLPRKTSSIYISLIAAMVCGRAVWGGVMALVSGAGGAAFTWGAFISGAFTSAIPGIVLHIALIPVIVMALQRAFPRQEAAGRRR